MNEPSHVFLSNQRPNQQTAFPFSRAINNGRRGEENPTAKRPLGPKRKRHSIGSSRPSTSSDEAAVVSPIHATEDATRQNPISIPSQRYHSGAGPLGFIQASEGGSGQLVVVGCRLRRRQAFSSSVRLCSHLDSFEAIPQPQEHQGKETKRGQRGVDRKPRRRHIHPLQVVCASPNPVGTHVCWFGLQPLRPKPPGISSPTRPVCTLL